MKKNVWLWNHYATNMASSQGGRHYWFAKNLTERGYKPAIFCANTFHRNREPIALEGSKWKEELIGGIPLIYVKTKPATANNIARVRNMVLFYKNLFPAARDYAKMYGKPDVIIASSVHPLTLVAGIQIAKKFNIPCICEVRDLWPESLVAYHIIGRKNPFTMLLYKGEKWIYKKANAIIMTCEGGKDYIIEQGWDQKIELNKVFHINNGVDIESFDRNSIAYPVTDPDLTATDFLTVVYAGSIRKVNNLGLLLDTAKIIQGKGYNDIRFLFYGSGFEYDTLIQRCQDENINNVLFKGWVDKKFIPSILKQAHVNILHNSSTSLDKYGQSQNKLFEYLAAGKCIIQTYTTGYSILERYECGISAPVQNAEEIAKLVITICNDKELNLAMGSNARKAAFDFDFIKLTDKLIDIIESV